MSYNFTKQQELIMQCWQGNSIHVMYTYTIVGWITQTQGNTWTPGKLAAIKCKLDVKHIDVFRKGKMRGCELVMKSPVKIEVNHARCWRFHDYHFSAMGDLKGCLPKSHLKAKYSLNVQWSYNHGLSRESVSHECKNIDIFRMAL